VELDTFPSRSRQRMTTPETLLRSRQPRQALAELQAAVRRAPGDLTLRIRLFQILVILGEWDRAEEQLGVIPDLEGAGGEHLLAAPAYARLIDCERARQRVFSGCASPLILGEPFEWMGLLVEAVRLLALGNDEAAVQLHAQALEAAPASAGKVDEESFTWIADADSRLGPTLELFLGGSYYWAPFLRIRQLVVDPPRNLQDRVWLGVTVSWTNGGQAQGYVPVRYPETERAEDGALQLAEAVQWLDLGHGLTRGLGQRVLCTDGGDNPLLRLRRIEIDDPPA
jgi:type VI secretion system protein ImpE